MADMFTGLGTSLSKDVWTHEDCAPSMRGYVSILGGCGSSYKRTSHSYGRSNQFRPEHSPALGPTMHSYWLSLEQLACGFHVHAGRPPSWLPPSLATASRSALVMLGKSYALVLESWAWMGADTLKVSGTLNASASS